MKTLSVRELSQNGASKAVAAAESEPVLVTRNSEPAVWMVSARELARIASHVAGDEAVYSETLTLLALDLLGRGILSPGRAARLTGMSLVDFMQLCGKLHVPVRPEQPEDQNSELERLESRLEALDSAKEERRTAMREQYLPENDAPADERASWKRITRASAERRFKERV